jgi:hypothetical protein
MDTMFIEVIVVDAFNKTPVGLAASEYYNYYLTVDIEDAQGVKVYTSYGYAQNTSATFTYKVPSKVVGGEYTITAYNSYQVAPAVRLIRIRDYPRD